MNVCVRNKYVSYDSWNDYVISEGNVFEGDDGNFHIYF